MATDIKQSKKLAKMLSLEKEIEIERNKIGFYFEGKEVSWNDLPLSVRKHDYPYYFDKDGNDCYPNVQEHRLLYI